MTAITASYKLVQSKIRSISLPQVNWKWVYIMGVMVCFALVFFYVLMVNQLTSGAYLVKNYNKEITTLSKENKAIEAEFEVTGFLDTIHNKVRNLGFEKISEITYIELLDTSLAKAP